MLGLQPPQQFTACISVHLGAYRIQGSFVSKGGSPWELAPPSARTLTVTTGFFLAYSRMPALAVAYIEKPTKVYSLEE